MTLQDFVRLHAPCLPESTVRTHLKAGRNSATAMLTYSAAIASRRGQVKGRLAYKGRRS